MLKALIARLKQGFRTGDFPLKAPPNLPPGFRGRPVLAKDTSKEDVLKANAACPVPGALFHDGERACLDMGKCIFCGRCAEATGKIGFSREYRLGVFKREDLVVYAGEKPYEPPVQSCKEALSLRHSLLMREVSAGGCAACELDANVLRTLAWDMARFGMRFAASPRHADALYLTGPVCENMQLALDKTFEAMPSPKFLIAAGACAISGGLYSHGKLPAEPALFIPGCPPHPATTMDALLRFTGRRASPPPGGL